MKLSGCTGHPGTQTIGNSGVRFPFPAEVIGQSHAAGGIAFHGVDAAVGGAGSGRDDRPGFGRQPIDPFAGGDGLAGVRIGAEGRPVTLAFIVFRRGWSLPPPE